MIATRKLTLVVDCDDYETESNRTYSKEKKFCLLKFLPKQASLVTTNTYFMRNRLILQGVEELKIVYLPNGVDTDRFREPSQEKISRLRTELNLDGKRVIGYFGSLNLANHPVDLLIRSFKLVVERVGGAILLLVGGGKDFDCLENLAKNLGLSEKIVFTGRVNLMNVCLLPIAELAWTPSTIA